MSATNTPQMPGTTAPSGFEIFWEKNKKWVNVLLLLAVAVIVGNEVIKYMAQRAINQKWSAFAAAAKLQSGYDNQNIDKALGQYRVFMARQEINGELAEQLAAASTAELEQAIQNASAEQKPYLIWASAYKYIVDKDWGKAEAALDRLSNEYKSHELCVETAYPVQFREVKPLPEGAPKAKKPDMDPEVAGSLVSRMRHRLQRAKDFEFPAHFAKPAIPADAPKVRITFKNYGDVVIALLPDKAPEHCKEFLKLLDDPEGDAKPYFEGIKVDQVHRPGKRTKFQKSKFRFGLEKTKETDNTAEWTDTTPSKRLVAFEEAGLSHFPGAVAADLHQQAEGKSCVDRIWIYGADDPRKDGHEVIFAYVVEGMDIVERICKAPFVTEAEEDSGAGKPSDAIEITSVTRVEG